ncbi:DUF6061 family protein [Enterocloster sp. HCN-30185]|uniref:DUF6061 family protein n=1 Tax=Enterocloster sp. HCN-30185 TaxID=3134663 RepID=UPI0030C120BD
MRKILSCEFNPDTACVEMYMEDGTMLSIDCVAVENEVANSMSNCFWRDYFRNLSSIPKIWSAYADITDS